MDIYVINVITINVVPIDMRPVVEHNLKSMRPWEGTEYVSRYVVNL